MKHFQSFLHTIRALPEEIRKILAGIFMVVLAFLLFNVWVGSVASRTSGSSETANLSASAMLNPEIPQALISQDGTESAPAENPSPDQSQSDASAQNVSSNNLESSAAPSDSANNSLTSPLSQNQPSSNTPEEKTAGTPSPNPETLSPSANIVETFKSLENFMVVKDKSGQNPEPSSVEKINSAFKNTFARIGSGLEKAWGYIYNPFR